MLMRLLNPIVKGLRRSLGYTEQVLQNRLPGIPNTSARIAVNEQTALRFAAVFACIRCIAETKASLPYEIEQRQKSGRWAKTQYHPVLNVLDFEPNPDMTPMLCAETRELDKLSGGNGYAEIVWGDDGIPVAIIPRHWSLVHVYRDSNKELKYQVTSQVGGPSRTLDRSCMLHVPAMGNGIMGWSPIRMFAETIGIGMAQDKFTASYFGNGAKPSLVVEAPGTLGPDEFNALQNHINTTCTADNAHRPLLLEGGLKATPVMIPADEAQLLESREFQEEVIARIYRVPPHMIGLLRRATFSNIEAQDLSFEKHTMRPHFIRDEQELTRKLFRESERGQFRVRINAEELLRADITTRYNKYKTGIMCGILTQNECRVQDNLEPIDGADELLRPEAVFGKSGGVTPFDTPADGSNPAPDSQDSQKSKDANRNDPRFLALTEKTVNGLIAREITHAARAAKKPAEFRAAIEALYDTHRTIFAEKLSSFRDLSPVMERLEEHRDALLRLESSPNLVAEVDALAATWSDEACDLATELLSA